MKFWLVLTLTFLVLSEILFASNTGHVMQPIWSAWPHLTWSFWGVWFCGGLSCTMFIWRFFQLPPLPARENK